METLLQTLDDALGLSHVFLGGIGYLIQPGVDYVNRSLTELSPSLVICFTLITYFIIQNVLTNIFHIFRITNRNSLLKFARNLPVVKGVVERKVASMGAELKKDLQSIYNNEEFMSSLPKRPISPEMLLKKVKHYQMFDTANWQQGRISGAIYTNNSMRLNEILLSVYGTNMWSNPLHSDVFAGIRKMEGEIIRMVGAMFNGVLELTCGSVTSGGTESIVMACKAYRDYAIKIRGLKGKPEIVAPVTAHAAFEKAANMLGCKIVHIPVDKHTYKVDMKAMRRAINRHTCMLVGSAPQFPHGIIDPIRAIAHLGRTHKIPVHVDACLGGFIIPFAQQAGFTLDEDFDFRVPGVTSISADTHKYGYAPKGTSVILYSHNKYLHQQYSIQTDWPGGIYASPTLPGSRPGALIATCWAAMLYHGQEGYVEATTEILKTTAWITDELRSVQGLKVLGDPKVSVIAFTSDTFDIFELNSRLKALGWNLNPLQFPSAIHICITRMHTIRNVAQSFVREVKACVKELLEEPRSKASGSAAIYGMAQTIPDRSIVSEICTQYLDGCIGL